MAIIFLLLFSVRGQDRLTPYLEADIPGYEPPVVAEGEIICIIRAFYDVDTADWDLMKDRVGYAYFLYIIFVFP